MKDRDRNPSPSRFHDGAVPSRALRRDVNFRVYLPVDYDRESRIFPVLYLLHGRGGNEKSWSEPERGDLREICDAFFRERPQERRVVVMPDAGNSWYRDTLDDSSKYETFFFSELMPEIEKRFRCGANPARRAVAGLSMGGYGALLYALRRPDVLPDAYAMSPSIRTREEVAALTFPRFKERYGARADLKESDERFDPYFDSVNCHYLVAKLRDEQKTNLRIMIDCGDLDALLTGALAFFQEARANGVNCRLNVAQGDHQWSYWRDALKRALDFFAENNARTAPFD